MPAKCAVDKNTKCKAERILNQLLAEYDGHEIVDDSYYSNVKHIEPFFSREGYRDLYIENLTCDVIEKFYTFLLKCGKLVKRKNDDDPGGSGKYVCEISKNFKAMLDYAHDKKVIFVNKDANPNPNPNPAKLVKVSEKRKTQVEISYLGDEDPVIV